MIYTKNIRTEKGSITIAAAVMLCAVILLNTALYDYVAFKIQESRAAAGMMLACKSVLASYDSLLAEKYGLYGFNTGSGGSADDLFKRYYHAKESSVSLSGNFTEPDVLKRQICDLMKIKTPLNLTETILQVLGAVSDAQKQGADYRACGEAAEQLAALQKTQNALKRKTEGYFPGDPICVNGYSQALTAEVLRNIVEAFSQNTDAVFYIDQAVMLCEQYQEYNNEAALLCRELAIGTQRIEDKLQQAARDGSAPEEANRIRKQAAQIASNAAAGRIAENLSVFAERLSVLREFKESGRLDIAALNEAFFIRRIDTDIRINLIHAGNGGSGVTDARQALKEEIMELTGLSAGSGDAYVVPPQEYAAFPSVRTGTQLESMSFPGLDAGASFDSFDTFSCFFSFGEGIPFGNLFQEAKECLLTDDYIISYMTTRLDGPSEERIKNETEYILNGDASARKNNRSAEHKILALRFLLNFIGIMKDGERSASAEAMARAIAASLSLGAGVLLYKFIIVSAWALLDSYRDLETLLAGKSVPILKFGEGPDGNWDAVQNYPFYLRILLLMTPMETKLMRICDLIEVNMKELTGQTYRLSGVYHKITASAKVRILFISPLFPGEGKGRYYREDSCELSY